MTDLILTREEADRLDTDGQVVLFRKGNRILNPTPNGVRQRAADIEPTPPAEFVAAAEPCETCVGRGTLKRLSAYRSGTMTRLDTKTVTCPHCVGGKRRITAVTPCGDCLPDVVVEWGPLIVVDLLGSALHDIDVVTVSRDGEVHYYHHYEMTEDEIILPPDINPHTLVGQYALCIRNLEAT